ncbi:MAG: T9SS type A sorting domain-containing protein [candidate division Zixibacteria bacterium]|nr:T9SS type A sorting domain-containing protein [candidate division Zixibacteria bacterium]
MKRTLTVSLLVVLILGALSAVNAQNLRIFCIDVGQGDGTLIVSPTGGTMLVDAGEWGEGDEVEGILDSLGINSLDYTVATHYHADHIGGLRYLDSRGFDIGELWDRGWEYCTYNYTDYASRFYGERNTITDGHVFDLGGGVTVTCLAVNGNGQLNTPYISSNCSGGGSNDENDFSVSLRVDYGGFNFFVAGDLSGYNSGGYTDIETSVGPECGYVDVYRVDHQGSFRSSNPSFLNDLLPPVSIISVGYNTYGHPHDDAINRILGVGSVIYQTGDTDGSVVHGDIAITTDGTDYFYIKAIGVNTYYEINSGQPDDTVSIAQIQDNIGYYDGRVVTVKDAVVTLGSGVTNPYICDAYIEDNSGKGINVFSISLIPDLVFGNKVTITAEVDQSSGTTQLVDILDLVVEDENQYVWDTEFTTGAANDISWEGTRMWVGGTLNNIDDQYGFTNLTINDGSGNLIVNVSDFTGIDISDYSIGDFVNAYGVLDVYATGGDTTYQVLPGYDFDLSNSDVTIKMIPNNPPVVVNRSGGQFRFTGILRNNTSSQRTVDVWIMLELPWGPYYGPLQQFNNIPIAPYNTITINNVTQDVPSGAPLGDYMYWSYCGNYPSDKWDTNGFPFRVVPGVGPSAQFETFPSEWVSSGWEFGDGVVLADVDISENLPSEQLLVENYPNPFNPVTSINYTLPSEGDVKIAVYNMLGQKVGTLVDGYQRKGFHQASWDGSEYASGVYFYSITAGNQTKVEKMMLVK